MSYGKNDSGDRRCGVRRGSRAPPRPASNTPAADLTIIRNGAPASARLPRRLALLDERAPALVEVLRLLVHLEVAGGELLGLGDRQAEALEDGHLRAPDGDGRVLADDRRQLARTLHQPLVRDHLGDEPHLVRALRAHALVAAEQRHAEAD